VRKNMSKKRIFIAGGGNTSKLKSDVVQAIANRVCGVLAHRELMDISRGKSFSFPVWYYDDLGSPWATFQESVDADKYDYCLNHLLSDPRTFYLAERVLGVGGHYSSFNHVVPIEIACRNSLFILKNTQPDRIIFMAITHQMNTWIFGRCAELTGIPVYFSQRCPLPWRAMAFRGIDEQQIINVSSEETHPVKTVLSEKTREFIANNALDYKYAIPWGSRDLHRLSGYKNSLMYRQLKILLSKDLKMTANNILRIYRHNRLYKEYSRHSSRIPNNPYVVLFLHFQPEATTLPLGGTFVQQWLAIRALSDGIPEGISLVVKEHPAMFWFSLQESFRNPDFYRAIRSLGNATLVDLESDPFDLIDNSVAVATITGTVGVQALCRKRPVMIFGNAAYRDCPGVFNVRNAHDVRLAMEQLLSHHCAPDNSKLEKYFHWIESVSLGGDKHGVGDMCSPGDEFRSAKRKVWGRLLTMDDKEPLAVTYDGNSTT
jgi:hypothetical protein